VEFGGQRWRSQKDGEATMTVLRSVAAAMVLFTLGASPVFAKVAFQDLGCIHFIVLTRTS
jgi:hypothetical protein